MRPIGKAPSYLVRIPHSYCFRLKVPVDIQARIGKKELRYSLRTGYLGVAKVGITDRGYQTPGAVHAVADDNTIH